jgi:hypothetical protein
LYTAGPNFGVSVLGLALDSKAFLLPENSKVLTAIRTIMTLTKSYELLKLFDEQLLGVSTLEANRPVKLGKLATKIEAAGKVRVFAITDG